MYSLRNEKDGKKDIIINGYYWAKKYHQKCCFTFYTIYTVHTVYTVYTVFTFYTTLNFNFFLNLTAWTNMAHNGRLRALGGKDRMRRNGKGGLQGLANQ